MKYEELITKHKDILEFRERPYNERAYIEEFLKLAEKKVKNLTIPVFSKTVCECGNLLTEREIKDECFYCGKKQ